jgi:hypothetical protein
MIVTDLWLDDDPQRKPPSFSDCGLHWTWAYNYEQAIDFLKTGTVEFASLDHDLADEHYIAYFTFDEEHGDPSKMTEKCKEKTGYDVLLWMEENNVWPKDGVRIHTMNNVRGPIMLDMVYKHYGRTFQYIYAGTHAV